MNKRKSNEMYVYLSIRNLKIHPNDISVHLEVEPTRVISKGDPIGRSKLRHKASSWEYRVLAEKDFNLDNLISALFKKFKIKKTLKMIPKLGSPEVVCVFYSRDRLPELIIGKKNLKLMSEMGASFWIDYNC